jgi:hypothetical protein
VTTGRDPLTGNEVSDVERALAVLGTIPGGGTLVRVAGTSSITVVRRVLGNPAIEKRLRSVKEIGEAAADLVDIFKKFGDNVDENDSQEIVAVANTLFRRLLEKE